MSTSTRRASLALSVTLASLLLPGSVAAAGTVKINETDLGTSWFLETINTGSGSFVTGPSNPPYGSGSFEMDTLVTNVDKSTFVTTDWTGRPLSDLSAIDYWTYRDPSSTSPSYVAPSINIAIFTNASGPGTGFATLVFEPLYSYGNDAIDDGVWQRWDGQAPSVTGFAGGWWTTRDVGSNCAFACFSTLGNLQAQAPGATIISVGLNVGRGPASFIGAVDGLSLTMSGETTTYDFEPLSADNAGCKDGGWQEFHNPVFKNQGDCVSFFASSKRQGPKSAEPVVGSTATTGKPAHPAKGATVTSHGKAAEHHPAGLPDKQAKPDKGSKATSH